MNEADPGRPLLEVVERRLENGLRLVMLPGAHGDLVSYWTLVRVGSRDEGEPGRSGFAHFFEHMMFRGSENFSAERTNEIATRMGAQWNAFTSFDFTAYHYAVARDALAEVVELEADRFLRLRYDEQAFRDEAGAVLGEYRKSLSSPAFALHERLVETAFDVHPYGHTVLGRRADIEAMQGLFEYSWRFFGDHYRPDNACLVVAGDVDVDRLAALVETHYGAWEPGHRPAQLQAEGMQERERRVDVDFPGRALARLVMAYRFEAYDPSSRLQTGARALAELAFGRASELYGDLVVERSIVESLAATADRTLDPRFFCVHASTRFDDALPRVIEAIERCIAAFAREGPSTARLDEYKRRQRYALELALDTPGRIAAAVSTELALSGEVASLWRAQETIASLTPDDVRDAARAFLSVERRTLGTLLGRPE